MRRINADILKSRIEALEGKLPKGRLGITGPAGTGKTQFCLTAAARLSHHYNVSLLVPNTEFSNAVERLRELGANMSNVKFGLEDADVTIVDDVTELLMSVPKRKILEFFKGLRRPYLVTSQIRDPGSIPSIRVPRIRRYVIDERIELIYGSAYLRLLTRKKLAFYYEIRPEGFTLRSFLLSR